jgi:hypothetical protein
MVRRSFKSSSEFLSIFGAFVLFFSWLASNIVEQRLKEVKDLYESASLQNDNYNIYYKLEESISLVGQSIIKLDQYFMEFAARFSPPLNARNQYALAGLSDFAMKTYFSLQQIDVENSRLLFLAELSREGKNTSDASRKLEELSRGMGKLFQEKKRIVDELMVSMPVLPAASDIVSQSEIAKQLEKLNLRIEQLIKNYQSISKDDDEAVNNIFAEFHDQYTIAKNRSEQVNQIANYLYVGGTILILLGAFVKYYAGDKT